ncbi:MAG: metallophosphoesterase, partial [Rhodospirillales bacterium]|nr:metallophosphoesterase [Rhodospirillales bacterium]
MHDIGNLDGPVLVFGGPYGNLQAVRAVLAEAKRLGIPPSRVICTGDVVAYCADPAATVDVIRDWGIHVVMGNCEESLGFDEDDCGCGFEEGSACQALSVEWFARARAALDGGAKTWMRSLPRTVLFTLSGRRLAAIHGGGGEISRFIFASTASGEKKAEVRILADTAGKPIDGVIAGHCGLPFTETLGDRLWHNAGVIGMPA